MEPDRLPPELEQLERQLAARHPANPPPELRQRTLDRLGVELRGSVIQDSEPRTNGSRGRWAFAVAVAVSVLVWINLSLCATSVTNCRVEVGPSHERVSTTAAQINQLLPELGEREASRQASLLDAGSRLALYPDISTSGLTAWPQPKSPFAPRK
jgi:hypothetical protein